MASTATLAVAMGRYSPSTVAVPRYPALVSATKYETHLRDAYERQTDIRPEVAVPLQQGIHPGLPVIHFLEFFGREAAVARVQREVRLDMVSRYELMQLKEQVGRWNLDEVRVLRRGLIYDRVAVGPHRLWLHRRFRPAFARLIEV